MSAFSLLWSIDRNYVLILLMKEVYLDNAAATPVDSRVLRKMIPYMKNEYGNPSSLHFKGLEAKRAVIVAREKISKIIGGSPFEIIFTSSGTESANLAIFGVAEQYKNIGKHIIVSSIEHAAVFESVKKLQKLGFKITFLKVDAKGYVDLDELKKSLRRDTILVSIIYANNEIGTIQKISQISKIIKTYRNNNNLPILHIDACQAPCLLSMNAGSLGADLLTLNSAKVYGPKGVGLLFKNKRITISPTILGERGLRSGTENVAGIIGFTEALGISDKMRASETKRLSAIKKYAIQKIYGKYPEAIFNGDTENGLASIINVSIPSKVAERMVLDLSIKGVCISSGSACIQADSEKPSRVLSAIGLTRERALASIRISMGRETTKKDIDYLMKYL